ncbi:MAG: phenylalanine--tRNA ligase subunit alpha [Clostridia bacterium]
MKEQIEHLINECDEEIRNAENKEVAAEALQETKIKFLGKNGKLTAILRGLKDVSPSERPLIGQLVNEAREKLEKQFLNAETKIKNKLLEFAIKNEYIDITADLSQKKVGSLHPLSIINNAISNIFIGMGFEVLEGPEIETDYYNFQALNIPKDHPARDMQDTFYVSDNILLRTHTSPNQVRTMEIKKPPIKMICPGKVYRSDDDATHSPIFNQIEGLVVDKGITLCDLKGTLEEFAKSMFDSETKTRLRPSFFPFTEPSVEVDLTCSNCHGKGCRLCKGTGWMEVLGAGMVNPKVLENCGIDSSVYSGFAFGLGIERIAMIRYGIPDIRLFFENDVRFLRQFKG